MIEEFIKRQIKWSKETFGNGRRTIGVTSHIRSELDEILAAPDDLEEWIDVIILAFDGAWRTGHSPREIITTLRDKQLKNIKRQWPNLKDKDVPVEHIENATSLT